MPEISRFYGIVIKMFFNDHGPPHFHAIYGEHEELLLTTLLSNPFDTLLINDRTTFHGVTPIQPAAGKGAGFRDTLILDFNRLRSDS